MDAEYSFSRRNFIKKSVFGAAAVVAGQSLKLPAGQSGKTKLRLGGPVFEKYNSPDEWIQAVKKLGYSAAFCPSKNEDLIDAFAEAAKKADIIIAETGAWSNPISPDEKVRQDAIARCCRQLALADRIGARCCVNISGSRNEKKWDGPHPDNLTENTFDMIVQTTRTIIDNVKPTRTFFTLETMPWAYPDSADSYLRLIKTIDRKQFAVHLDPVNLICSPQRYYKNADIIRECFQKLGPYVKSCHAKDIILRETLTTHLDETRPGTGGLDYTVFLQELSELPDTPIMLEHLSKPDEYRLAAEYIRSIAVKTGLFEMYPV